MVTELERWATATALPKPVRRRALHPALEGLLVLLPPPGETWSPRNRQLWLDTIGNVLDLVYRDTDAS